MARTAANSPDFGRAANNIFSGWTSPSRYESPADVEKNFKIFLSWKNHSVAIKVIETTWHSTEVKWTSIKKLWETRNDLRIVAWNF